MRADESHPSGSALHGANQGRHLSFHLPTLAGELGVSSDDYPERAKLGAVKSLDDKEVVDVVCGGMHAVAITAKRQVRHPARPAESSTTKLTRDAAHNRPTRCVHSGDS